MPYDPLYLPAGDLRHSITIESTSVVNDEYGQPVSTWDVVLTTRAKIESTMGNAYKELVKDGAIASQSTDVVTIRWTPIDLKPGMRVIYGDNTLLVQAVDNILRRNRVVKLFCLQIDADTN
jgi:SPP1 family predicted phage head-tail adaptor